MIIAVDFDGTCVTHDYPNIGKDIGAVPVLKELVENGHKIILYTMRWDKELKEAVQWFESNDIPLFGINENLTQRKWTKSPKIYAHLYIDDAALGVPLILDEGMSNRPFVDWKAVNVLLQNTGVLEVIE
jgi:hypothetical protein